MNKNISIILLILIVAASAFGHDVVEPNEPVNIAYAHSADFDGDGAEDIVIMHIIGKSWNEPFKWTLDIISGSDTILHYEADDSSIEEQFETFCFDEAKDYLECKQWYYLTYMPRPPYSYNPSFAMLEHNAKPYLEECCDLSAEQVDDIMESLKKRCDDPNTVYLELPICPAFGDLPKVYVPEIGKFVIIYRP